MLVIPTVAVRASFLAAMAEFAAEGRGEPADVSNIGHELREQPWGTDEAGFAAYVGALRADVLEASARRPGYVPCTTLWWVAEAEYLGRFAVRHRLTKFLREHGGHIGYDIRASRRRQGHATAMLRAGLPVAARLGIDPALITCRTDNLASRRVIEAAGGEFEDERDGMLRFWVNTGAGRRRAGRA